MSCPESLSLMMVRGKAMCCPTTGPNIVERCVRPVQLASYEPRMFGGVGGLHDEHMRTETTCKGKNCKDRTTQTLRDSIR